MDFDELYEQHFHKTYQYIRYMVSNAQLAEDLTQDTFLRIYKTNLAKIDNYQKYTRQVARNLVYDYYRKKALIEWLPFKSAPEQREFVDLRQIFGHILPKFFLGATSRTDCST
ncbi:RNA polymerase sigma factor, partial [Solibacillus silvestris]|uniref:RNA polymerase sigma factor n=1 Tax=Solibacillus silvestris TaxID=76853 RepID=UPI003F813220